MKVLVYLSLVVLVIINFAGCKSGEEIIRFKPYKPKDYITKEIKVCEVKERLYPILDSIIIKAEECPMYQNLKMKTAFSFWISPGDTLTISVVYSPKFENHAEWTDAIFYYGGYDFYCDGFADSFLKDTGRTTTISCIDPKKYQFEMHFRGDMDMYWTYSYENDQIVNIGYGHCLEK